MVQSDCPFGPEVCQEMRSDIREIRSFLLGDGRTAGALEKMRDNSDRISGLEDWRRYIDSELSRKLERASDRRFNLLTLVIGAVIACCLSLLVEFLKG